MARATGLVLTGGALRGICAQVGALLALEPHRLRFDAVIGTSAGSIVGALFAAGKTPAQMEGLLAGLRREDYLDPRSNLALAFALSRRLRGVSGYYRGEALLGFLRRSLAPRTRIEECDPPLAITVTNVSRGVPQVKTRGPLAELARASSAIPLVFELQAIDGEYYADGGVANNVPLDELAKLRPDLEQFLVLTSLRPLRDEPPVDNRFLEQDWTPARALGRTLDAVAEGQRLDNLNVGGRRVQVLRLRTRDIDLDEPQHIPACVAEARQDAQRQIDAGAIDLSEIPRR
jgi:predicted acylesterase/phospholipase RssA